MFYDWDYLFETISAVVSCSFFLVRDLKKKKNTPKFKPNQPNEEKEENMHREKKTVRKMFPVISLC